MVKSSLLSGIFSILIRQSRYGVNTVGSLLPKKLHEKKLNPCTLVFSINWVNNKNSSIQNTVNTKIIVSENIRKRSKIILFVKLTDIKRIIKSLIDKGITNYLVANETESERVKSSCLFYNIKDGILIKFYLTQSKNTLNMCLTLWK